jgi:hypothetical protein
MAHASANQAIVDRMLKALRREAKLAKPAQNAACDGFQIADFLVNQPNNDLIASVEVTAVPAGAKLVGVTVAATPNASTTETYCMGVASEETGLGVPIYVLGSSTSPALKHGTPVLGILILDYVKGATPLECVMTKEFLVARKAG